MSKLNPINIMKSCLNRFNALTDDEILLKEASEDLIVYAKELECNAKYGEVLLKHIDRLNDPAECDTLDEIVKDLCVAFEKAMPTIKPQKQKLIYSYSFIVPVLEEFILAGSSTRLGKGCIQDIVNHIKKLEQENEELKHDNARMVNYIANYVSETE